MGIEILRHKYHREICRSIDCVYHFALPELERVNEEYGNPAVIEMLDTLVTGKRLRDISDLPFNLTI